MIRPFKLSDKFIEPYKDRQPPWGPLGYVTYKRTYSRRLDETEPGATGTEEWWQTCRRVIEGMFSIQKKHVKGLGLAWNDAKAQETAKDAYERLFQMKWTPPGRGLWACGTKFVEERTAAALYNCGFTTTKDISTKGGEIFAWIMDALMLGIGVGFDTLGERTLIIRQPGTVSRPANYFSEHLGNTSNEYIQNNDGTITCYISDCREGWIESVRVLLDCFLFGYQIPIFIYDRIRGPGQIIATFGGVSSGPDPLKILHQELIDLYSSYIGLLIDSVLIVDTENLIGKCVVSGNVRRSAAIGLGRHDDYDFLTMKNDKEKLLSHRWGSNNSFFAELGQDYTWHANQTQINGEPGVVWIENARKHGRFMDPPRFDDRAIHGLNPCGEIFLESRELCNVQECYPAHHDSLEDWLATLKVAYLYGKTITLTRTHWEETNAAMQKNRRIGLGQAGVTQAIEKHGLRTMFEWCEKGYEYIQTLDAKYSDWLCIPRSKRTTTVKPGGTVPLLSGATPGIHYPEDEYYIRRIRFASTSELIPPLREAGYLVEPCIYSPNTLVVAFPIKEEHFTMGKREVSMWEQLELAAAYQYYWADNSVSVTVTFKESEGKHIAKALQLFESRLKAVSFLKYEETGYEQAPYEPITKELYEVLSKLIKPIKYINSSEAEEAKNSNSYCDGDSCLIDYSSFTKK